ncbi:PAS domain S-box protein [bacterium]|nr:PAS domain S-box protein [bacterium]
MSMIQNEFVHPQNQKIPNLFLSNFEVADSKITALIEMIDAGIVIVDNNNIIQFANEKFFSIVNFSLNDIVGQTLENLLFRDQKSISVGNRSLKRGRTICQECRIRKKNDGSVVVRLSAAPVKNSGEVVGSIWLFTDIAREKKFENALIETKNFAQNIIDSSLDMIIAVSMDRIIIEFNRAAENNFGYKRDEVIGKHVRLLYADSDNSSLVVNALKDDGRWEGEVRNKRKNGETFFSYLSASLMCNEMGFPVGIMGVSRDITERKTFEDGINKLSNAIEHLADCVFITDDKGIIEYVNPAFTELTGYTRNEAIGNTPRIVKSGKHSAEFYRTMWHTIASGLVFRAEVVNKKKDESLYYEEITISPIKDSKNEVRYFVSTGRNITERKIAEKKLQEYARILDLTDDAIIMTDLNRKIIFWNQGAEKMYGWTSVEVVGRKVDDFLKIQHDPNFKNARQTIKNRKCWQGELNQYNKSGQAIVVSSRWSLLHDDRGEQVSLLIINTDISARKRMEIQLARSRKMESLGSMASGIAHDLNNIFTPILVSIESLKIENQNAPVYAGLQKLESYVSKGVDLVKQIISFTTTGSEHRELKKIYLHEFCDATHDMIAETISKSVMIHVNIPKDIPPILANPSQLFQVMMNLCVNARDAMPQGGVLTVNAAKTFVEGNYSLPGFEVKEGEYINISVSDTGVGISEEKLDKIFDPFFTTKPKGTGLGLSTVFSIVRRHNGFIQVNSKVNAGTTFNVFLPTIQTLASVSKEIELVQ